MNKKLSFLNIFILSAILVATFFSNSADAALKCFVCDSTKTEGCVEYDYALKGEEYQQTCADDEISCSKIVVQGLPDKKVTRGCSKTDCKDEKGCTSVTGSLGDISFTKSYFCGKDLCNDSTSIKNNKFVLLSLVSLVFLSILSSMF